MIIYKYDLDRDTIIIPLFHKVLDFKMQNDTPCIWLEFDDSIDIIKSEWRIHAHATGDSFKLDQTMFHIGTFHTNGLVWHYYLEAI